VFFPFMFRIHKSDLVTVGQGKIAYVFARDGAPLGASQVLGANDTEDKSDFQDARRFLTGGGQKGPQRKILREGTYAINLAQFVVVTESRVYFLPLNKDDGALFAQMAQVLFERHCAAPDTFVVGEARSARRRPRPRAACTRTVLGLHRSTSAICRSSRSS